MIYYHSDGIINLSTLLTKRSTAVNVNGINTEKQHVRDFFESLALNETPISYDLIPRFRDHGD